MTTNAATIDKSKSPSGWQMPQWLLEHWPLALGLLAIIIPAMKRLGEQSWSTDAGAHAPIVLATGIWLIFQIDRAKLREAITPANSWIILAALAIALPIYIFGRAYDFISLEAGAVYLIFLTAAYKILGGRALIANFFPFLYLAFIIPPPGWVIDRVTAPLQTFISWVATTGLSELGYPIVRYGVTLFIAQYQLLVEQACSGMNSIMGLIAISMFYIYVMHKSSWRYALFLMLLILPVAIITNLIRVIILVLLTYYYGDGVAQGFLHSTAGILLFVVALMIIFGLDMLFQAIMNRRSAKA